MLTANEYLNGDYTGSCPVCGGNSFYLSGFKNPLGGKNGCANCGYIATDLDRARKAVTILFDLARDQEKEVGQLRRKVNLRNKKIRSLRRELRKRS